MHSTLIKTQLLLDVMLKGANKPLLQRLRVPSVRIITIKTISFITTDLSKAIIFMSLSHKQFIFDPGFLIMSTCNIIIFVGCITSYHIATDHFFVIFDPGFLIKSTCNINP